MKEYTVSYFFSEEGPGFKGPENEESAAILVILFIEAADSHSVLWKPIESCSEFVKRIRKEIVRQ